MQGSHLFLMVCLVNISEGMSHHGKFPQGTEGAESLH